MDTEEPSYSNHLEEHRHIACGVETFPIQCGIIAVILYWPSCKAIPSDLPEAAVLSSAIPVSSTNGGIVFLSCNNQRPPALTSATDFRPLLTDAVIQEVSITA